MTTIDHISNGRAIMGIGGAWFEGEHQAFGLDFGSGFGQRLDWLAESVPAVRALLDGEEVTSSPGGRYQFDHLRIDPLPVQRHLPIMIGGGGEKKTLRIVAQYADMWNVFGTPETVAHKDAVLREHCATIGRDESTIERTLGCKVTIRSTRGRGGAGPPGAARPQPDADVARGRRRVVLDRDARADRRDDPRLHEVGFSTFIVELPAPYDLETIETLMTVVKPMVEGVPVG